MPRLLFVDMRIMLYLLLIALSSAAGHTGDVLVLEPKVIGTLQWPQEEMGFVSDMAVAEDRFFFAEPSQSRIAIFDEDGKFITTCGGKGQGPGEFSEVYKIAVSQDLLFALDPRAFEIEIFDFNGQHIQTIKTGFFSDIGFDARILGNQIQSLSYSNQLHPIVFFRDDRPKQVQFGQRFIPSGPDEGISSWMYNFRNLHFMGSNALSATHAKGLLQLYDLKGEVLDTFDPMSLPALKAPILRKNRYFAENPHKQGRMLISYFTESAVLNPYFYLFHSFQANASNPNGFSVFKIKQGKIQYLFSARVAFPSGWDAHNHDRGFSIHFGDLLGPDRVVAFDRSHRLLIEVILPKKLAQQL